MIFWWEILYPFLKKFICTAQDRERTASQDGEDAPDVDFFEAEASSFSVPQQPLPQSVKLAVRNLFFKYLALDIRFPLTLD